MVAERLSVKRMTSLAHEKRLNLAMQAAAMIVARLLEPKPDAMWRCPNETSVPQVEPALSSELERVLDAAARSRNGVPKLLYVEMK